MNRRRLESEAIRDSLLSVAGRLDTSTGGPAVRDFTAPRRTLYIMTIRSDRSGYGPLFDAADPTAITDRRTVSTVAPQSLFMLNSPFVMEQSRALADRLLKDRSADDVHRIGMAYTLLYGRPVTLDEVAIGREYLSGARRRLRVTAAHHSGAEPGFAAAGKAAAPAVVDTDRMAWREYAQLLLCANEFMYID